MRWMIVLLLALSAPARAEPVDPAGRWAVRSQGRVLMLVTLARDETGWRGSWTRPRSFHGDRTFTTLFALTGPTDERRLLRAAPSRRGLHLEFTGDKPDAPAAATFRVRADGTARLRFDQSDAELALDHATTGERPIAYRPDASYPLDPHWSTNPRMTALFEADQAARVHWQTADMTTMERDDARRRGETRALLDAGALESGEDFLHAAFVFQHGQAPDDYLLAHVLATVAVQRGAGGAGWIAAATLDRFLQTSGRAQVFGTQFQTRATVTQEPYDRALLPDSLRRALGVPPRAEQASEHERLSR
jgi:hypothetical protein